MQLHTERTGSGPSLVFIHGWQNDTNVWNDIVTALAPDAECVSVDLPGHGRTTAAGPQDYERDHVLTALGAVVDSCSTPPVLVGHSLGGFLSLSYAATRPGTIAGLALVATGPGYRSEAPRAKWNQWVMDNVDPNAPAGQELICLQHDSLVIDSLPDIDVPTVVVAGEREVGFHAALEVFVDKMPAARSVIVPDAGHMVHVKKPGAVVAAIRPLISR